MTQDVRKIPMDKIRPNIRMVCTAEAIEEIRLSVKTEGLREPIVVWFAGRDFRILDGEKRWRACKQLGWGKIRAVISHWETAD